MKSIFFWGLTVLMGLSAQETYTFSDGGRQVQYRMSQDEVYSTAARTPSGGQKWGSGRILKATESPRAMVKGSWARTRKSLAPVFYYAGDLPSADKLAALPEAERERRLAAARRVMTNKLLVHAAKEQATALVADTHPVQSEAALLAGWTLVSYADAFAALEAADALTQRGGVEFTPVFSRMMEKRQALKRVVNDPFYSKQWHLQEQAPFNLGMRDAWDSVTGKNINIAVIDDGLEARHEDLSPNVFALGQGLHANFNDGDPNDPSPTDPKQNHGTNSAGLAGAAGFNNLGVTGVAPEAGLMGLRLIAGDAAEDATAKAMAWQPDGIITHVSSNSWGPADDGMGDGRISALQLAGMEKAVTKNRNGLGTVMVVSAGNGRGSGDDESYDGFSNSRFVIAVGAVNRGGSQSSYSESGMGVAISAFGGEFEQPDVMWTTNNMGDAAFAIKAGAFPTSEAPLNYTDSFNGTSAACPQISGAAALLLEKNPRLGYRDVKEILMTTGNRNRLQGKDEFVKNGAGLMLSHSFGAGVVDVKAALDLAEKWTNLGPEISAEAEMTDEMAIADNGVVSMDLDLSNAKIRVEHVEFTFTVKHAKRGDLSMGFLSPAGTLSQAFQRPADENADFTDYTMTSVMSWGESAAGKWKVVFADNVANGIGGTVTKVKLKVYGTAQ